MTNLVGANLVETEKTTVRAGMRVDRPERGRRSFIKQNTIFLPTEKVRCLERNKLVVLVDPEARLGATRLCVGLRDNFRAYVRCVGFNGEQRLFRRAVP
jgi:hypothetical protein